MRKTETYRLNQWDPDDRIRREDFNADNAAVEAALKALSTTSLPEFLYEFTESDVTSSWSKPILAITDWSKWNFVIGLVRVRRRSPATSSSKQTFFVIDRDSQSPAYNRGDIPIRQVPHCNWGIYVLMVGHNPDQRVEGFFISPTHMQYIGSPCTYREFGDKMELAVFQNDSDAKMDTFYWVYGTV